MIDSNNKLRITALINLALYQQARDNGLSALINTFLRAISLAIV